MENSKKRSHLLLRINKNITYPEERFTKEAYIFSYKDSLVSFLLTQSFVVSLISLFVTSSKSGFDSGIDPLVFLNHSIIP